MPQTLDYEIARWDFLGKWHPRIGDVIIRHGWLTHWFGIVSAYDTSTRTITIVKDGMPKLLMTMSTKDRSKRTITLSLEDIVGSRGGQYAVMQPQGHAFMWYIEQA